MLPSGEDKERPFPAPSCASDEWWDLTLRVVPLDSRAPGGMVQRLVQGGLLCSAVDGSGATAARMMMDVLALLVRLLLAGSAGAGNDVLGAATELAWATTASETGRYRAREETGGGPTKGAPRFGLPLSGDDVVGLCGSRLMNFVVDVSRERLPPPGWFPSSP